MDYEEESQRGKNLMKCLQGKPLNIEGSVLGKIVKNDRLTWFSRSKQASIYVTAKPITKLPRASGYILSEISAEKSRVTNAIYGLSKEDMNELTEGDIVLLEKDGKINFLYEINSHQNAIFATNRCNLRCVMCPQPPYSNGDDKLEMNLSLVKMMDSDKTTNLAITGGEPTLLGEGLFRLVGACKEHLPKAALAILTNGKTFKDIEFVRSLTLIAHPMITIAIPLYSDDDRMHDEIVGIPGSFFDVIKGLQNLAMFKHRIEIRTVIHALNYKRLPKLADFIYHNLPFVSHVALMGLEVTGFARKNIDRLWIDPYEYRYQLEETSKKLNRYDMKFSIYNHQLCVLPEKLWQFCRKSISTWKNIYMPECERCSHIAQCGGFFETSDNHRSQHIRSVTN